MAGVVGIEPTSKVLETFVLPLNYTPTFILKEMVEGDGFEPPNPKGADLQSAAFGQLRYPSIDKWWLGTESNRRHTDFQSVALPTELPSHK